MWAAIIFAVLWAVWALFVLLAGALQRAATGSSDPALWPILVGGIVIGIVCLAGHAVVTFIAGLF